MIGLLYDVHGNLPALEAVLADAAERGVERFVLGGDYALFGAWPTETLERLREVDAIGWVRGNGERWTADPGAAPEGVRPAIEACAAALGDRDVTALASLPTQISFEGAVACHASPISDVRSFLPEPADDELELLDGITAGSLFFGHTHLPFARLSEHGVRLVNPGSVGMPFDGDPRASYATLDADDQLSLIRVKYDHLAVAAELRRRRAGDWAEQVAGRIERASF